MKYCIYFIENEILWLVLVSVKRSVKCVTGAVTRVCRDHRPGTGRRTLKWDP